MERIAKGNQTDKRSADESILKEAKIRKKNFTMVRIGNTKAYVVDNRIPADAQNFQKSNKLHNRGNGKLEIGSNHKRAVLNGVQRKKWCLPNRHIIHSTIHQTDDTNELYIKEMQSSLQILAIILQEEMNHIISHTWASGNSNTNGQTLQPRYRN